MAGNKNSGRKSALTMINRAQTAGDVLVLSLETLREVMMDKRNPVELRVKAAIPIASKYFPEQINVNDVNGLTREEKIALALAYIDKARNFQQVIEIQSQVDEALPGPD